MNSNNYRNCKFRMAGTTQNGQNQLIFVVVPQLQNANGSRFVKKDKRKQSK